MALEFADKNVLIVDGKSLLIIESFKYPQHHFRFYRPRYHLKRNYSNGEGRRSQEGHRGKLCTPYPVCALNVIYASGY